MDTTFESLKKCPYCAEMVKEDAVKCKHCNEWFDKKNIFSKLIDNSKSIYQNYKYEVEKKKTEHLFLPTETSPLKIHSLLLYHNRIEIGNKIIPFDTVTSIYFNSSSDTANLSTNRKMSFLVFTSLSKTPICMTSPESPDQLLLESNMNKLLFEQLHLAYQLISKETFEIRLTSSLKKIKESGEYYYNEYIFKSNGDIYKENRPILNLHIVYKNNLVSFGSSWSGLRSTSENPFEFLVLSGGVQIKVLWFETGHSLKIETYWNHDVFDSIITYFIMNKEFPSYNVEPV